VTFDISHEILRAGSLTSRKSESVLGSIVSSFNKIIDYVCVQTACHLTLNEKIHNIFNRENQLMFNMSRNIFIFIFLNDT